MLQHLLFSQSNEESIMIALLQIPGIKLEDYQG